MAREWYASITGNVVRVDKLYKSDDFVVKNITVAVPFQIYDKKTKKYEDNTPEFVKINVYGKLAEEVDALGISTGCRVTASGYMDREAGYVKDGEERTGSLCLRADTFGINPIFGDIVELKERKKSGSRSAAPKRKQPEPTFSDDDDLLDDSPDFDNDDDFTF